MRAKTKDNAAQLELGSIVAEYQQRAAERKARAELARLIAVSSSIQAQRSQGSVGVQNQGR